MTTSQQSLVAKNTTPCPNCGHWRIAHRGEGICMGTFGGDWCFKVRCQLKEAEIMTTGPSLGGATRGLPLRMKPHAEGRPSRGAGEKVP